MALGFNEAAAFTPRKMSVANNVAFGTGHVLQ
jgi:hypothetical protein